MPTTERVLRILERHAEIALSQRRLAEWNMYQALMRRFYLLLVDEERQVQNVEGSPQVVIYDLGGLPIYLKSFYANIILTRIYQTASREVSDGLKMLVVAEESQNYVIPRRPDDLPTIGERFVNELRSHGVGIVLIAPDPQQLPIHMLRDVAAVISTTITNLPLFMPMFALELDKSKRVKRGIFVFYKDRLHHVKRPRPPKTIQLPEARVVVAKGVVEATVETRTEPQVPETIPELRLEEEEEEETEEVAETEAPEPVVEEVATREPRGPIPGMPGPGNSRETKEEELPRVVEVKELEAPSREVEVMVTREPEEEELRFEEEEELKFEEEWEEEAEEAEEKVAGGEVAPEPSRRGVYRLFGHELEEVKGEAEVSKLRCLKCGAEAPITEVSALKERPCKPSVAQSGGGFCKACGKPAETSYCEECAAEFYAVTAKPLVNYGARTIKVLPPLPSELEATAGAGSDTSALSSPIS